MTRTNGLKIDLQTELTAATGARECLALCVYTDEPQAPDAARLDEELRTAAQRAVADGEFKGEADSTLLLRVQTGRGVARLLLVGLGQRADLDAASLRRAAAVAARAAQSAKIGRLHFVLPPSELNDGTAARAAAEGAVHGLYVNDFYQKREDEETPQALDGLVIVAASADEAMREAVERGRVVAESANWARTLADEPGLSLTPRELARRAAEMAAEVGLEIETLRESEIRALGMGALLGVARGSDEEPTLIVLRYEPDGAPPDDELWAFVGKGITFDTGGISLKRGPGMEEMKSDMAGGAAALGALRALALLKAKRRVVAVVPATENMPSGKAIKPGDVVRTLAGYTIEVVDTDAEGRLVLSDGIGYAKRLGATRIVDLATLTGSIIVALGDHRTGMFSNDDEWAGLVRAASERAGEPLWRMPVSDDYKKKIESDIADFKNYGGRPDATGAALLLSKFAGDTPWAHLDIAGTAWHDAPRPYAPKGATGAGVRTLVELVCG